MYRIFKDNTLISTVDELVYLKPNRNDILIRAEAAEATSLLVNDEEMPLSDLEIKWIDGAAELAEAQNEFESLLADTRNNLVSIPTQGAAWSADTRYIAGDTVEGGYIALKYNRNKKPADYLGTYWEYDEAETIPWESIEDGTVIYEGGVVRYGGKTWRCTAQHFKSSVYKPKENSSKWEEFES